MFSRDPKNGTIQADSKKRFLEKIGETPLRDLPRKIWAKSRYDVSKSARKHKLLFFPPIPGNSEFKSKFKSIGTLSDDLFVQSFYDRIQEKYFFSQETADEILQRVAYMFGESNREQIISCAEEVCNHYFYLLGSGRVHTGKEIDWLKDFKSGERWPLVHRKDLPLSKACGSDIIVVWELSRFQHIPTLGKAYLLTRNEKYLREFNSQIKSWLSKNPFALGPNWYSPQDVAMRAISWISGFFFFYSQDRLPAKFWLNYLRVLFSHGMFIYDNLPVRYDKEGRRWTNTHYLSAIVGLLYLGVFLGEVDECRGWLNFGREELFKEIEIQTYSDGVDYESSISCYHRFALEHFVSGILLLRLNHYEIPDRVLGRLEKMFEFVCDYLKPDGRAPQMGDTDDGRVQIFSQYPYWDRQDHRYILSMGGEVFGRDDFKEKAGGEHEEAIWLTHKLKRKGKLPIKSRSDACFETSRAYPEGGFYFMKGNGSYTVISANRVGMGGLGNHKHNDVFSFEIYANGTTYIIDPGSYCYTPFPKLRNLFRSTYYHNVLQIDSEEINSFDPGVLFRMREEAFPKVLKWESNDEYDLFEGEHYGFSKLSEPLVHTRKLFFNKKCPFWILKDDVWCNRPGDGGNHVFDEIFHLGPLQVGALVKAQIPQGVFRILETKFDLYRKEFAYPLSAEVSAEDGKLVVIPLSDFECRETRNGMISRGYGIEEEAPILIYRKTGRFPASMVFLFFVVSFNMKRLKN